MLPCEPRVSIVIPVWNHERYIAECVESALSQTFREIEVVVVDDGSTDGTPEILRGFGSRIRCIRQENRGGAAALNTAIRNSRGEFIAWLSSDDVFLPDKLEEQIGFFRRHPGVHVSYTDFFVIDSAGNLREEVRSPHYPDRKRFLRELLVTNFVNGSSVVFRKSCLDKVGFFDEAMRYHADGNMWTRMLKHFDFGHVPKTLLKYRWHDANLSHHFWGMWRYLDLYYRKVFDLYSPDDLCPEGADPVEEYLVLIETLTKHHRLYGLSLSLLSKEIRSRPADPRGYAKALRLGIRMPALLLGDLKRWARTARRRARLRGGG